MHAFVHIGNRVARGGDQGIAAPFGFAHLRLDAAQPAACLQVGPFRAHQRQQVFGAMTQHDGADAMRGGLDQRVFLDPLGQQDDRDVLAAAGDLLLQHTHRDLQRLPVQGQVDLPRQHAGELFRGLRSRWAHRDAAVAQRGHDRLCAFDAVVDHHQAEGEIFTFLHARFPGDGL